MAITDPHFTFPAAVLFDFDGVIVDSEPVHMRAFQRAAAMRGIDLSAEEYFTKLIGFDDRGAWRRVFELRGLNPDDEVAIERVMEMKFAAMRELLEREHVDALPGVRELLEALRRHDRPCAICSGATRGELTAILRGTGLESHFAHITAAEDVPVAKPDPSGYLQTLRALVESTGRSLRPQDCLVIEDAPKVIRTVKSVGFRTLGVTTSYPRDELRDADWVVSSLRRDDLLTAAPQLEYLFEK